MECKLSELVKRGHDQAAELKSSCGAVDVRDVAQLISDLATQLDVQLARSNALAALAAENAGLKAGASYFSYGSEYNFEWHKTAEEAAEAAEAAIDDYRGDACDGWSEEVDSVCWGIILQSSTKVGERPRTEDDRCDPAIDTICDYALLPNIETPATDSFLAELRASAIEDLMEKSLWDTAKCLNGIGAFDNANDRREVQGIIRDELKERVTEFAAQLRKGVQS